MTQKTPLIALTLGDPGGIGPELVAKLLAEGEATQGCHTVLIGDRWLWQEGQRVAGVNLELPEVESFKEARDQSGPVFLEMDTVSPEQTAYAEANAAGGASVLAVLSRCIEAHKAGEVDGICFAPLNKYAMKLGGLGHEDELHWFVEKLGVTTFFSEFNTLGTLWTSRISSHVPLKDAHTYITEERIVAAATLIHDTLKKAGFDAPRVAVAGFNPHAGEGGTCGREEIDIIAPAVEACVAKGYPIVGPFPADTVFLKARDGELDAVVTMYHDQGQIAIKMLGFDRGVTILGGLPVPVGSPAHGTAFDIAGQGKANLTPTRNAFNLVKAMCLN
ncbi:MULTISPECIES: 4-hydroxythreonine-4-phosphate dehydrogenase PdxA [Halomonas]|uniref:4-hydroxythreonine-4-phosphate dehydrogenase PdxA n=1 Tax=Halomonas TaxID=2745 RepID=UPI001C93A474|nr:MULTISPECIES: 4-hydroxythreonine-4-phosphate dehydrogenase PdxA [Halomonas]MBY6206372.1 4-hydroxythreonine-4-phosphate dehydrogenase PdxA [Halomonas sp. DP3Y7-2]MBY6227737.1 4-hydroxythreonine-4-phosphate dehydrogenase PdxA [Halomonas sp. DP3Y7-1]MCA0915804.1 4-hydroxythreonine-4-phosphate dehydrogenase PdxA [Halomonas denitrificans]